MAADWVKVASTADVAEGSVIGVLVEGEDIAIYNLGGVYHATENICTHEMARLSDGYLEGEIIECPLHAAQFNVRTGCVVAPPASAPLRVFRVRVEGTGILVDLGVGEPRSG